MLQGSYGSPKGILQKCYRKTGNTAGMGMLKECCRNAVGILDAYCGNTAVILQECCRRAMGILEEYCRNATGRLGILLEYCRTDRTITKDDLKQL